MSRSHGAGDSEAGQRFAPNEDSFGVNDGIGLYVVCDGASRCAAGEVASKVAVEAVNEFVENFDGVVEAGAISDVLAAQAVQYAFDQIFDTALAAEQFEDMDTTLTMMLVGSDRAAVGHVGDSRLYLVRNGSVHQLTVDHDLSDNAGTNGNGSRRRRLVDVDRFTVPLMPRDLFLLCTDGLNAVLEDSDYIVELAQSRNLKHIVRSLLQRESELQEGVDATAVVVRVDEDPGAIRLTHIVTKDFDLTGYIPLAA